MAFDKIHYAPAVVKRLRRAIENNSIMHAYIFEGDYCVDKLGFAKEFAKAILCRQAVAIGCDSCAVCRKIDHDNYEDIYYVQMSDKGNILDEAITELQENLRKKPLAADRNIAIIENADRMNTRAQNRLLKTLEEPSGNAVIILLSENAESLLQTIRSRCGIYRLNDYSSFSDSVPTGEAEDIIDLLAGKKPFYIITDRIKDYISNRQAAMEFLDALEFSYRNLMYDSSPRGSRYKREEIYKAIHLIEDAKMKLKANVTISYVIKGLMLELEDL